MFSTLEPPAQSKPRRSARTRKPSPTRPRQRARHRNRERRKSSSTPRRRRCNARRTGSLARLLSSTMYAHRAGATFITTLAHYTAIETKMLQDRPHPLTLAAAFRPFRDRLGHARRERIRVRDNPRDHSRDRRSERFTVHLRSKAIL